MKQMKDDFSFQAVSKNFICVWRKHDKTAVISIAISLKDTREKETGKSIMFQKKYTREEPLQESSPRGYCQAASQAMRIISEQITNDIYTAVKTNVQ